MNNLPTNGQFVSARAPAPAPDITRSPRRIRPLAAIARLSLFVTLSACGSSGLAPPAAAPGVAIETFTVTSHAFAMKGAIPVENSCDGADQSPQLSWSAPPAGTKSLAIVVEDPDAPSGEFTHWIVFDLPPTTTSVAEGFDAAEMGARVGMNDAMSVRYGGPCPPRRELHRYVFRVFALNGAIDAPEGATKSAVYAAMSGHVLGEGVIVGLFSR